MKKGRGGGKHPHFKLKSQNLPMLHTLPKIDISARYVAKRGK